MHTDNVVLLVSDNSAARGLVLVCVAQYSLFFLNDTATTEIYTDLHTLSLHDALPICAFVRRGSGAELSAANRTRAALARALRQRGAHRHLSLRGASRQPVLRFDASQAHCLGRGS